MRFIRKNGRVIPIPDSEHGNIRMVRNVRNSIRGGMKSGVNAQLWKAAQNQGKETGKIVAGSVQGFKKAAARAAIKFGSKVIPIAAVSAKTGSLKPAGIAAAAMVLSKILKKMKK